MNTNIYPRTNDLQTIYLNAVIDNPDIKVGDYTIIVPIILYALYRIIRFLYFLRNGSWTREISLQPGIIKVIS